MNLLHCWIIIFGVGWWHPDPKTSKFALTGAIFLTFVALIF